MQKHLFVVTGASRGLGLAMAQALLQPRHVLLCISRHADDTLARQAGERGAELEQWTADLADPLPVAERLQAWLAQQRDQDRASAALVNNAGMLATPGPLAAAALAEVSAALRVGLEAAVLLSSAFLRGTEGWAVPRKILNVSSGLGRRAMAGSAAYCAAKAGLDHFSRALALEQAEHPRGARVVALAPGVIDTDMQRQLRGADVAAFAEQARFAQLKAGGMLDTPEQAAAKVVAFLHRSDFGQQPVADVRD